MDFDGQLVRSHPLVKDLLERFVCVRIVRTNGLDLTLFQFDADMTFAILFLNTDKTVYGRFGTRSDRRESERDISFEGLRKAMEKVLDLHEGYPAEKALLAGKKGPKPRFDVPEKYPWVQGRGFDKHCMSCHHLHIAERMFLRNACKAGFRQGDILGPSTGGRTSCPKVRSSPTSCKTTCPERR